MMTGKKMRYISTAIHINTPMLVGVIVVIAAIFALTPTYSHAQIQGIEKMAQVQLRATPKYPMPGQKVELYAQTQAVSSLGATVTWRINGEVVQQSRGGLRYTYTAGPVGSAADIEVTFVGSNGRTVSASLLQRVQDVAVVWEGVTYTPPLFSGRALHSPGSEVRFYALPFVVRDDGTPYKPEELIFDWHYRGSTITETAGVGMRSAVLKNTTPYAPLKVSLFIKDLNGETLTIGYAEAPVVAPEVVFYGADPLSGLLLERALGESFSILGTEQTVYAEPYYMIAQTRTDPALTYTWDVSGQTLTTPGSLVLRPEGSGAGIARVDLNILNTEMWQQRAAGRLTLNFNATEAAAQSSETTPL